MALFTAAADPNTPATASPDFAEQNNQEEPSGAVVSDSMEETASDPTTSAAPVDPEGDTDASASNTTDVHPL